MLPNTTLFKRYVQGMGTADLIFSLLLIVSTTIWCFIQYRRDTEWLRDEQPTAELPSHQDPGT